MMSMLCILVLAVTSAAWAQTVEDRAREFLRKFDEDASRLTYQHSLASWEYNTNITAGNSDKLVSAVMYKRELSLSLLSLYLWDKLLDQHDFIYNYLFGTVTYGNIMERI